MRCHGFVLNTRVTKFTAAYRVDVFAAIFPVYGFSQWIDTRSMLHGGCSICDRLAVDCKCLPPAMAAWAWQERIDHHVEGAAGSRKSASLVRRSASGNQRTIEVPRETQSRIEHAHVSGCSRRARGRSPFCTVRRWDPSPHLSTGYGLASSAAQFGPTACWGRHPSPLDPSGVPGSHFKTRLRTKSALKNEPFSEPTGC